MIVGTAVIEIHIPASTSLKAKRSVLNRIKERLRNRFNASVAEIDYHDLWQRAAIGVATVGVEKRVIEGVLDNMVRLVEMEPRVEVTRVQIDFY